MSSISHITKGTQKTINESKYSRKRDTRSIVTSNSLIYQHQEQMSQTDSDVRQK